MMETKAFVNWQAVQKILDKETTQGLSATLLFTRSGALLTSAGEVTDENIISALVAKMWESYKQVQASTNFILVECEEGILGVCGLGKFLVCVYSNSYQYPLGLLKAKIERLVLKLDKPLSCC
mmetsp:Transcript_6890/g.12648  ORF Transcript_6890/g.12648 Transcript_6890/m.12648 type:complete len:123 (-) Transcript_6890:121-489(-)